MRVISIINLKGGVAKTTTAVNMAWLLAEKHGKRVLLVDMDKQGHASRFYGVRSEEKNSVADVLLYKCKIDEAVVRPQYCTEKGVPLDVLPSNMALFVANKYILLDGVNVQQTRLSEMLKEYSDRWEYVVIDHAPDIAMANINGLVASDDVIVPVMLDDYALDGLDILCDQIATLKRGFNRNLKLIGCLPVGVQRTRIAQAALSALGQSGLPIFANGVRFTCKVSESASLHLPLSEYAPQATASYDYQRMVDEYLRKVSIMDTGRAGTENGNEI